MRIPKSVRLFSAVAVIAVIVVAGFLTRTAWLPRLVQPSSVSTPSESPAATASEPQVLKIGPQARKNLGLVSRPVRVGNYSRKIQVPGVVVDQPGRSDRGITSPAGAVVTRIHAFPGDTVKTGDRLFTLRLLSDYLQSTQKELFTATRETQIVTEQLDRLRPLAESGGIAKSRIIDLENVHRRQADLIAAHRQVLLARGLNPEQIAEVGSGKFVTSIDIMAPTPDLPPVATTQDATKENGTTEALSYEVQALEVELGHQVRAGQLLLTLADHTTLYIEGHAFKREASSLETVARDGSEITVEFAEDDPGHWPELEQSFQIRHLANSIDTTSRTFDFFIPLTNQSKTYQQADRSHRVWRFRPGQRVRLHVPVEQLENVLVLPAAAVVREGPEAYVFRQNGDLFNRIAVRVLHEDRLNVVLANDGSVSPGLYLAQNAAASLNRILRAQSASGMPTNVHVHADGTVHEAH